MPSENDNTVTRGEEPGAEGAGTATAVKPATRTAPPRVDRLPPYRVLLHNDDVNDMGHVVSSIVELTPLKRDEALHRMMEAHKQGVALLLVTHKERAELYRDQFRTKSLTVSIEPGE